MQALILAAGRAVRLGKLAVERPKCLLEVGGRPLIGYSLDNLVAGGITEAVFVTGHREGAIRDAVGSSHAGIPVRYVFNKEFDTTGSVISLLAGASAVTGQSVLVMESDLLYDPRFIDVAMEVADDTLLVADASGSGDEVYICADEDGWLDYLGKAAPMALRDRSLGEFAGITRLSRGFLDMYCAAAKDLHGRGESKGHYEELIFQIAKNGSRFRVRHCPGLPWTEVDTAQDLNRASAEIYPRLLEASHGE